jgi:hypothetical protein
VQINALLDEKSAWNEKTVALERQCSAKEDENKRLREENKRLLDELQILRGQVGG